MKIQNKLFLFLFSFSLILVTVLVLLMQWSIGKGMVEYVVSKEVETLKPVIAKLSQLHKKKGGWHTMAGNHNKFRQLISEQLSGSEFETPQRQGPPKRNRPSKTNDVPPHLRDNRPLPPYKNAENLDDYKRSNHRGPGHPPPPHARGDERRSPLPESAAHYALLDSNYKLIVGKYLASLDYVKTPIVENDQVIGFFAISKRNELTQGYEVDFIEQQQHYLWLIALVVMLLVTLVTFPLARHVVEPIKLIARGMHKLTQGDYKQAINIDRKDEFSELSRDYNELALTLAENEKDRKRWLANISHELRTPVAILRGELEAMLDNVRPLTTENISSANDEVKHLQHLIDDLNLLTSTDVGGMRYRKSNEDLITLMKSESEKYLTYLADAGISLTLDLRVQESTIYVDKNRLIQLFENIINNSIKYSSATQFKISIARDEFIQSSESDNTIKSPCVTVLLEDNGVGVDDSHLPHLFEYLYRVEDSRNRKTGGSGLGLSICKHIVIAHQGDIRAQKSSLGGLAVKVSLPLSLVV